MYEEKKKKATASKIIILLLIVAVIILAVGLVYVNSIGRAYDSSADEMIQIEIPSGSSAMTIGNILEENGIIKSAYEFRLKSKLDNRDGMYKAGTYEFSASMNMDEIIEAMVEGIQDTVKLTVPEGYTVKQIAQAAEEAEACTAEEFIEEVRNGEFDYDFLQSAPAGEARMEGFLYPDTYNVSRNGSAHEIITMMLNRFAEVFTEVKVLCEDTAIMNAYSDYEILTAASIIEREVKLDSERPLVASVIYNRLRDGMKLQMCSTVQYALGEQKARLYNSDLETESPYNTYLYEGLPVGPISSPGRSSIEAAMNPADTDYLYFVVNSAAGDGSHNFAATGSDFNAYRDEYLASLAG